MKKLLICVLTLCLLTGCGGEVVPERQPLVEPSVEGESPAPVQPVLPQQPAEQETVDDPTLRRRRLRQPQQLHRLMLSHLFRMRHRMTKNLSPPLHPCSLRCHRLHHPWKGLSANTLFQGLYHYLPLVICSHALLKSSGVIKDSISSFLPSSNVFSIELGRFRFF